jgi:methionyl aminopeptidase
VSLIKSVSEQEAIRRACHVASDVLQAIIEKVMPGVTTLELDDFAAEQIRQRGARSAFLNYKKFPRHTCVSVNHEVVHGIAGKRALMFGDIVSLDVGVFFEGFVGDVARTVAVGGCGVAAQQLMDITVQSLQAGISQARAGNRVADISQAIQRFVEGNGCSVVREFVGHGVGRSIHEEPQVPNFVDGKPSPKLKAGMTIAIEPMVNAGRAGVRELNDGWTVVTSDGSLSAHFEHTVLVTETAPEILTWHDPMLSKLKV